MIKFPFQTNFLRQSFHPINRSRRTWNQYTKKDDITSSSKLGRELIIFYSNNKINKVNIISALDYSSTLN